jgi:hypothetical protein
MKNAQHNCEGIVLALSKLKLTTFSDGFIIGLVKLGS